MTMGGRWGTQWGSAAVREHREGEGGQNLGKKGSEGGAHRKGRTVALRHDFIEERVASVPEGGGGHRRRRREGVYSSVDKTTRRGVGAPMVLRLFYRRRLCSDREGKWGGGRVARGATRWREAGERGLVPTGG
jgi:hypothetical protein